MDIAFWQQRWQENQIGFHLPEVNPHLSEYWTALNIPSGSNVLVPLCGKSLDMVWLASQGMQVVGVECSSQAIQQFMAEQGLTPVVSDQGVFTQYQADALHLLQGDFFKLTAEQLVDTHAVYDRASLVALPEDMRRSYVQLLTSTLPASADILLVTLDYDQSSMTGPPFAVSDSEVRQLYGDAFTVQLLHEADIIDEQPRFHERGLGWMIERVYHISRR